MAVFFGANFVGRIRDNCAGFFWAWDMWKFRGSFLGANFVGRIRDNCAGFFWADFVARVKGEVSCCFFGRISLHRIG